MGSGSVLGLITTAEGRRPRVAVVGGTPASAMVASVLIEQFGCSPIASLTGEAAAARVGRDEIDLAVIDLSDPGLNGILVAQRLGALGTRALPMIGLADAGWSTAAPAARAAGISAVVTKPYSPRELYGAMRAALGVPATAASEAR